MTAPPTDSTKQLHRAMIVFTRQYKRKKKSKIKLDRKNRFSQDAEY